MEDSLDKYTKRFESFLDVTESARNSSERCRDYYDHKQWTDDEIRKLKRRKQAPVVINRIQPKVEALKGLLINQRSDPKAFPRTQKHEKASYAITDALRYVNDNVDLDSIEESVAENFFIEGIGAVFIGVKETPRGPEIEVSHIPWDRYYYDYHSRYASFDDSKYHGIVIWMDEDDARSMFPDKAEEITAVCNQYDSSGETYEDKPVWVDKTRKRIRVCQEYCLEDGVWQEVYFTDKILLSKQESPYFDEDGEPTCPIEAITAFIDRDLNRYGPVKFWLDLQDEINHRRSKALHLLSVRQTAARRGAIQDVAEFKREFAKPDGHVEYDGEPNDFQVLPTGDMAQAQFNLLTEAKQELDAVSLNAQLSGERQGDLSGKAVQALQAGGMLELAPLMAKLRQWKKAVYRQIWWRIKQFWREEKWIRVTDNYNNLHWVGLNHQMTVAQVLEEKAADEALPDIERQKAGALLQIMTQAQDPRLMQVAEMRNNVAELDVDIILDVSPDAITVQNEQFQILAQLAAARPEVPFSALLKLSQIREKDDIMKEMEAQAQAVMELNNAKMQLEAGKQQSEIVKNQTQSAVNETAALKNKAQADQMTLETMILAANPVPVTSVAI